MVTSAFEWLEQHFEIDHLLTAQLAEAPIDRRHVTVDPLFMDSGFGALS